MSVWSIRAAATALNLEFVSVGFEQYDLLVNFDDESDFELLLEILQSSAFRAGWRPWAVMT